MKDQNPPASSASASSVPGRCPRCGAANRCALIAAQPIERCWCHASKARLPLPEVVGAALAGAADAGAACYCPACLQALGATAVEVVDAR